MEREGDIERPRERCRKGKRVGGKGRRDGEMEKRLKGKEKEKGRWREVQKMERRRIKVREMEEGIEGERKTEGEREIGRRRD